MPNTEHIRHFHGLPVHDHLGGDAPLPDPASVAWRLRADGNDEDTPFDTMVEAWTDFASRVDLSRVRALVIGTWEESWEAGPEEVIAALVKAAPGLPSLEALFLGEILQEESELSWIQQGDATELLRALPDLRELRVRGGEGLVWVPGRHERLERLTIEAAGLTGEIGRAVCAGEYPELRHLELWPGVDERGGDLSPDDLGPVLTGSRFPLLRSLGLRNAEAQDEFAAALSSAPIVAQLEELDLSLGLLTDAGGRALLEGQPLTHLKRLNLHHHFLTEPVQTALRAALEPAGVDLDLSDPQDPEDEWRYVSIGE